jgi:hypothetical protein
LQTSSIVATSKDIIDTYNEWAKDREIEDSEYGLAILKSVL